MKSLFKKAIIVLFFLAAVSGVTFTAISLFFGETNFITVRYSSPLKKEIISAKKQIIEDMDEEFTIDSSLMLVNGEFKLSPKYEPVLTDLKGEVYLNPNAADAYWEIKYAVKHKFDSNLYIMSAYRSPKEQAEIIASGNEYAAKKGASEHLTGLAVDVYIPYHAGMGFIDTEEGKFVNKYCSDYGFIIRYPDYGEAITEIPYEPWHLRYVGFPHAKIISENKTTLEEYILSFEIGEFYSYENYIISRQKDEEYIYFPDNLSDIVISPDNTGCIIITGKR